MATTPTVAWQVIVASTYSFNLNNGGSPAASIALVRPDKLRLWVQVTGTVPGDPAPGGTLAVTSTPSTGVTISDNNFDGGSDSNHEGSGTVAENNSSQAEAGFVLSFANAGTFIVSAAYTEVGDSNYSNATIADPLTITVT